MFIFILLFSESIIHCKLKGIILSEAAMTLKPSVNLVRTTVTGKPLCQGALNLDLCHLVVLLDVAGQKLNKMLENTPYNKSSQLLPYIIVFVEQPWLHRVC